MGDIKEWIAAENTTRLLP